MPSIKSLYFTQFCSSKMAEQVTQYVPASKLVDLLQDFETNPTTRLVLGHKGYEWVDLKTKIRFVILTHVFDLSIMHLPTLPELISTHTIVQLCFLFQREVSCMVLDDHYST